MLAYIDMAVQIPIASLPAERTGVTTTYVSTSTFVIPVCGTYLHHVDISLVFDSSRTFHKQSFSTCNETGQHENMKGLASESTLL